MNYTILVFGILSLIMGFYLLPQSLKGLKGFEMNYKSIKGLILSVGGILAGIYLIAKELAKII